ncbi:MAG: hypothetical protein JWO98_3503 [Frankiales bacterium]|nr:hypothetical protein [Frankiales bacterium]
MRLRDFWRDLPKWAKCSFWVSIALGLICFAAGLYGDAQSFWGSRSYGVNMFTSLTSALFGVPFAGILVTWFTTSLEDRLSRTSAETAAVALTISAWAEIKEMLEVHLGLIDPDTFRADAKMLAEQLEKAKAIAAPVHDNNWGAQSRGDESRFSWATDNSEVRFAEDIRALKDVFNKLVDPWQRLRGPLEHADTINANWAALRGKWQFLSNTVKAQRLGAGLRWDMPERADSLFSLHFAAELSPLNRPLGTIFGTGNRWVGALKEIVAEQERSPLEAWRAIWKADIRYFEPASIADQATTAANTFGEIRAALQEVEAAGWPDGEPPR